MSGGMLQNEAQMEARKALISQAKPAVGLWRSHGILSLYRHLERRGYLSTLLEPRAPKNPAKSRVPAVGAAQSTVAKGKTQRGCIYKIPASWRDIRRDMNQPAHAIDTRYYTANYPSI